TAMYVFMNAYAPISLLLQAKAAPRAGSDPFPNWQPCDCAGAPCVVTLKNGFSGQMPVSRTPTTTPLPAFGPPPREFQALVAPMKFSSSYASGFSSVSFCTATTPGTLRSFDT